MRTAMEAPSAPGPRPFATTSPGAGGCDFLVDPDLNADESPVFWLPQLHSTTVVLVANPIATADTLRFQPDHWRGKRIERRAEDGLFLILINGTSEYRLWLPDPPSEGASVAALIPLDHSAEIRAAAAARFRVYALAAEVEHSPRAPPRLSLARHIGRLRALDAHLDGASYRSIADTLFGRSRLANEPWKTCSLRDTTIRLVRTGMKLMRGGYLEFLRGCSRQAE
ncbi:MAG: DUF2285 domain-containing protein [Alphaproteobacteria bacterium]|nr:DUF2285 domain-containing protein [Alphaproteobacteria bacterium]